MKKKSLKIIPYFEDWCLIKGIVERMSNLSEEKNLDFNSESITDDLIMCHLNGCELDLKKLSESPDFSFMHDIICIEKYLNRETGKLENCFPPGCSVLGKEIENEKIN